MIKGAELNTQTDTFEEARLAALGQFNTQKPASDLDFDDITLLASKICGSPMAALTFVDKDKVWITNKIGVDMDTIPRDVSLCSYTISQPDVFEVADTHLDRRVCDNPMVTQANGIRHYAGVPVFSSEGYPVGTLCVMDPQPKKLSDQQIELLNNLGRQATDRVQLQLANRCTALQNKFEQAMLAIAPAGIIVTDLLGSVTHFNAAAEEMLEYTSAEVVQKLNYSDLQLPEWNLDQFSSLDESHNHSPQKNIVHRESTCRTKSGNPIEIKLSSSPIYDHENKLVGYLHVFKDLREAKKTEAEIRESEARLRDLFHHTSDLIQVVDPQGRIIFTNRSWRKTLGYTDEQSKNIHMFDLIHPSCHGHCQKVFESLMSGNEVGMVEVTFVTKDGRRVEVEGDLSVRLENGVPVSTRGIFRDVTSRKRAEAFQKKHAKLLEFQAEIAKVIAGSMELMPSLQTCVEILVKYFDGALAGIWIPDESDQVLELQASAGPSPCCCHCYQQVTIGSNHVGQIAKTRLPILTNRLLGDHLCQCSDWIQNAKITSFAGLPLIAENRLVGVLAVFSKEALQQDAMVAMSSISNGLALSIHGYEKKEALRQSEARHRMLIQNSRDAMMTVQLPDWKFHSCNPAALELYGISSEEDFCQLGPWDVSPKQQPCGGASSELAPKKIKKALEEGVNFFEWTHKRSDGSSFPATVLLSRMEQKGEPFLLATVRDITEQKNTEAKLIETNRQLVKANNSKSEFLSRMSHELRTPLNGILGFSKLLGMDELTEQQLRNAGRIHDSGQHLLDLINEVLDLSRIEADRLHLESEQVDVVSLIQDVVDMIDPQIKERNIQIKMAFEKETPQFVIADRQRLLQVFLNLASNGVKYNRVGEALVFEIDSSKKDCLELRVCDQGPGISAESYEKVFEPFERLESSSKEAPIEGTGLGLALSKKLIEMMHGTIRLESQQGQGSTFILELPKSSLSAMPSNESVVEKQENGALNGEDTTVMHSTRPMKVLYIEDNVDNLMLVEQVIQLRDHIELISAANGKKGLEMIEEESPDLIFLDFHLPELNGDDILEQLKTKPHTADIPVYMLSADAMPGQIEKLKSLGAIDYITKPLDVQHFLSILDKETQN